MRRTTLRSLTAIIIALAAFTVILRAPRQAAGDPDQIVPENLRATDAYQAMKTYNDERAYPAAHIPAGWREKALDHIRKNPYAKTSLSGASWTEIGPGNIGGRVRSIAIDPRNPDVIYCGSVSGGIWKTTNGGASWLPASEMIENIVIGTIAIDPLHPDTVYAGTGEGYFNIDALRGMGLMKSTDGGAHWALLTNFIGSTGPYYYYYINRLIIRPDNTQTLLAALVGGIYRSTNGGSSWIKLTVGNLSSSCMDLVADPTNYDILYAAFGQFLSDGIYKSTNGGNTWSPASGTATGFPARTTKFGRISLAIAQSNPNILYACLADSNYYTHSIQKTTDGGAHWAAVATPYDNSSMVGATHLGGQGWYDNVIEVDPTDANIVYTGGINIFKTINGGSSWSRISDGYGNPYVHVDQHEIAFRPGNHQTVYFGNDGGMFKTTNGGTSFSSLDNGLATVQFYSGEMDPNADIFYGGTQDNGTLKSGAMPAWGTILGGDGGAVHVDFNTPTTIYGAYIYLLTYRSTNRGTTWSTIMNGIPISGSGYTSDRCAFIAPSVMDPNDPTVLLAGTYRIYRTTNRGDQWSCISLSAGTNGDVTGDGNGAGGVGSSGATVSAIRVAPSASGTIYVGTSGSGTAASRVLVTTNTGSTWTNITTSTLPNRYVKDFAIDPASASHAFVVYSGYGTSTPSTPGHIYTTTDRGASWNDITGDLADVPVNAVVVDPSNTDHLVIGTDLGAFVTVDAGLHWVPPASGMPNVSVAQLFLRSVDGTLVAATHGRGMFIADLGTLGVEQGRSGLPKDISLAQNYPNPFNPSTTISFDLPRALSVRLTVYDALGRRVSTLIDRELPAGHHLSSFNGTGLASGVYLYRLEAGKYTASRKMLLTK